MTEPGFQKRINNMYRSLGGICIGDIGVTIGFCRREPVKYVHPEREKCVSKFFTFNEVLKDFL
jgi:hypothetical protein